MARLSALKLEIISSQGSEADKHFPLTLSNGSFKIGRASASSMEKCLPGNGLFESKVMSRNHATFTIKGDKVFVQDGEGSKGSSHGTYLGTNGSTDIMQRLSTRPCEVHAGDVLSFGKHVGSDYQETNCQPVQVRVKIVSNESKKAVRRQFGLVTDESEEDELEALPDLSGPAPTRTQRLVSPPSIVPARRLPSEDVDEDMDISRVPSRAASPAASHFIAAGQPSLPLFSFDNQQAFARQEDDFQRALSSLVATQELVDDPFGEPVSDGEQDRRTRQRTRSIEAYSPPAADASSSPASERNSSPPPSDSDALASPVTSVHDDNDHKSVKDSGQSSEEEVEIKKSDKGWNAKKAAFAMTCEPLEDEIDPDQTQAFPMQDDDQFIEYSAPEVQNVIPSSVPDEINTEMDTFMASDGPDPFLPEHKSEADPFEDSQDAQEKVEGEMGLIADAPDVAGIRTPIQEHSVECPPAPDLDQELHESPRHTFVRSGSPQSSMKASAESFHDTVGKARALVEHMRAKVQAMKDQEHHVALDSDGQSGFKSLKRKRDETDGNAAVDLFPSTYTPMPASQVPTLHISKRQRIATFAKTVAIASCWMAIGSAATVIGLASMADED